MRLLYTMYPCTLAFDVHRVWGKNAPLQLYGKSENVRVKFKKKICFFLKNLFFFEKPNLSYIEVCLLTP